MKGAFIVGCRHSGTSILLRLLDAHSQIYAIPYETKIFLKKSGIFFKRPNKNLISRKLNAFDNLAKELGKTMWIEKTPLHIHHINLMFELRKEAKVIGITRDPRDVACSLKEAGFTFEEGILRWLKDNTALLAQKREGVFIVKLEDIISHPKENIKKVLDFLKLPYENLLNYHLRPISWYGQKVTRKKPVDGIDVQNHRVRAFRNWQINQPLFKTTQRYITDMKEEDKKIFAKYAKEVEVLAKRLGYYIRND